MRIVNSVILVDDDRTNTRLIKVLLEMDGFQVVACPSVLKAREAIDDETTAFVIDCNLAHGDNGLELLSAIREGRTIASPKTPVIVTSGDYRWQDTAEKAGASHFLLKPFSPGDLTQELARLIGQEKSID